MSEILTSIGLSGAGGLMEWGRKTRAEMIEIFKHQATLDKATAERILAASDD
jgi:hypothetical protein